MVFLILRAQHVILRSVKKFLKIDIWTEAVWSGFLNNYDISGWQGRLERYQIDPLKLYDSFITVISL